MHRAVRRSLVGLALLLLFWLSLAPPNDRESFPPLSAPEPSPEETLGESPTLTASEPRRSAHPPRLESSPVEAPASAPAPALPGRFAFDVLVMDDEARPVEGATVSAFMERSTDGRTTRVAIEPPNEWSTDASGRCLAQVLLPRRGTYVGAHLAAEKPGVGVSGSLWVSPETAPQIRLVLWSPVQVEVRVFGADGRPATDATVHFSRENRPKGEDARLPSARSVDADGRLSAVVRDGGQFEVWAESAGLRTEEVRVDSFPGSRHEITFWVPGAFTIEGVLRDPSGRPVAGGKVFAWEQDGSARWEPGPRNWRPYGFRGSDSDREGRYRIPVPLPGTYLLAGVAEGFASSLPREVSVEERDPHPKVDLTLFEAASLSGVVRMENGQPLAGLRLQAVMETPSGPFASVRGRMNSVNVLFSPEHRTAEDGNFSLTPLHPMGTYAIRHFPNESGQTAWDHRFLCRDVRAGTRGLEIVVPDDRRRICSVTGVVLGPGDAGPPLEFGVSLDHDLGDDHWVAVEHLAPHGRTDGRFTLDRAFAGERYVLRAWGRSPGAGSALVGPWIARPEGKEFPIRLKWSGSLACRVVDGAGRPVPFAEVEGGSTSNLLGRWGFPPERADESGFARFNEVAPGSYRIRAWKGTHRSDPVDVELLEGETRTVTIPIAR